MPLPWCPDPLKPAPRPRHARPDIERLEDRLTPSTLVAVTDHRDLVYDSAHGLLYITTSSGKVQRYDPASNSLLSAWTIGGSPNGADITPDGGTLYVTDRQVNSSGYGVVHKVDTSTGAVTNLTFFPQSSESGSWDISVASSTKALVTTRFNGSGWVPLRQLDLSSGTFTIRTDDPGDGGHGLIAQDAQTWRGADRGLLFFTEEFSNGASFTYSTASDTFPSQKDLNQYQNNTMAAVSPDGSRIAVEMNDPPYNTSVSVLDRNLNVVQTLTAPDNGGLGLDGGLAFDPVRPVLYIANSLHDQVVAYDTRTWTDLYHLDVGENISGSQAFASGVMTVSPDGHWLFLTTPAGVRVFDLTAAPNITVGPASVTEGNSGTSAMTFTVRLSKTSDNPVTVSYATADGTATAANDDYQAASGSVTFSPGDLAKTVTVNVVGNTVNEANELFYLNLTGASGGNVTAGQAAGTVFDDDPVSASVGDVTVSVGGGGTRTAAFPVTLSRPSEQTLTVGWSTADGTASAAAGDYTAAGGTLTFNPGETAKTVSVSVNGAPPRVPGEAFSVNLTPGGPLVVSQVADVNPGATGSAAQQFIAFNNALYFEANDGTHGAELYRFDGNTVSLAADINPGAASSSPTFFAVYQGALYFNANDGVHGAELYKFDGTTASLAADTVPNNTTLGNPAFLTVFNNLLVFTVVDSTHGTELWKYDGTTASLVSDIYAGANSSFPGGFAVYNNKLYFVATTSTYGRELWSYDGNNTSLVADIVPGTGSSSPNSLQVYNGALYLTATTIAAGAQLYRYDGTSVTLAATINPKGDAYPGPKAVFNNALYFEATDGTNGYELWKYDGTSASRVADIVPGSGSSFPGNFAVVGNTLYFTATTSAAGTELWQYDGTNVAQVADVQPGAGSSSPQSLTAYNGALSFGADDGTRGAEFWKYDVAYSLARPQGTATVINAPSLVQAPEINGDLSGLAGKQRSMVDDIVYTFDRAVSLAANAFTIALHQNVTVNGTTGQTVGTVPTLNYASPDGGVTWVVTFSGDSVVNGSIADGVYDITLNHAQVTDAANRTPVADQADTFFRMYGNTTGGTSVATVNNVDYRRFAGAFGSGPTDANYLAYFDFFGGGISNAAYRQFARRFGQIWSDFTATI